ncbi:MAG: hypothetical protein IIV81_00840, partial [Clostridia bacterium]|nr:hypothetical protein [Clostridia bacterium]
ISPSEAERFTVFAVISPRSFDISPFSEKWAKKNIEYHGLEDRCTFKRFDLLKEALPECDAITINPPYITAKEMKALPENVKREPSLALFGGDDGLDFYRRIKNLSPKASLFFEMGYLQGDDLIRLFEGGEIVRDLSGNDRVFIKEK